MMFRNKASKRSFQRFGARVWMIFGVDLFWTGLTLSESLIFGGRKIYNGLTEVRAISNVEAWIEISTVLGNANDCSGIRPHQETIFKRSLNRTFRKLFWNFACVLKTIFKLGLNFFLRIVEKSKSTVKKFDLNCV